LGKALSCFSINNAPVHKARPNHQTSDPDLTNALVAEWKQVLTAMFQHLVESLPIRVEAVIGSKEEPYEWNSILMELHINGTPY
jgi:hypothetical protein